MKEVIVMYLWGFPAFLIVDQIGPPSHLRPQNAICSMFVDIPYRIPKGTQKVMLIGSIEWTWQKRNARLSCGTLDVCIRDSRIVQNRQLENAPTDKWPRAGIGRVKGEVQ